MTSYGSVQRVHMYDCIEDARPVELSHVCQSGEVKTRVLNTCGDWEVACRQCWNSDKGLAGSRTLRVCHLAWNRPGRSSPSSAPPPLLIPSPPHISPAVSLSPSALQMILMPSSPCYPQYYLDPSYKLDSMHHHDHGIPQPNMPPPRSPQIDPTLSLYPSYYQYQHQPQHQPMSHHLPLPHNLSSPSSQGSDTIGTPPTETMSFSPPDTNGKRPSSLVSGLGDSSRKKARIDDSADGASPAAEKDEPKPKSTRGAR